MRRARSESSSLSRAAAHRLLIHVSLLHHTQSNPLNFTSKVTPQKMKYSISIAAVAFAIGADAFSASTTASRTTTSTALGAMSRRESFAKAAALVGGLAVSGAAPAIAEESLDFSLPSYESSLKNTGGFGDGNEAILNVKADTSEKSKQNEAMKKAEEARQAAKEAKMAERKAMEEETKRRAAEKKKRDADRLKGIFE